MERVSSILICFLVLFLSSVKIHSNPHQAFFSGIAAEFSLFEENGKVGLKDQQGQVVIPAQYEAIGWSDGTFSTINNVTGYRKNDLWGLLNIENNHPTKVEYVDLSPGAGSLLVARKKIPGTIRIQTGCINTMGKEVIPFQYDGLSISAFRAIVYVKSGYQFKKGLIDLDNNILVPLNYQSIYPLGSLRYAVEDFDNKTAIFSDDGKQITSFLIDSISAFRKDLAIIYQNRRQGLIDRQGQIRLEPVFREITILEDGAVNTRYADAWLMLDGENNLLRQHNADSIDILGQDLLKVKVAGKIHLTNKEFIPLNGELFSKITSFREGKALFKKGNKTGVINAMGTVVVKPLYDNLIIDNGFIRANLIMNSKSRWILLDIMGTAVTSKNYEYIGSYNGKYFPLKNRGYWGALDGNGKEIIACVHDSIVQQLNDLTVVKFKGRYGVVNSREDWIITPQLHPIHLLNDTLFTERVNTTTFLKSLRGKVIYFSDNRLEIRPDHFIEYLPSGTTWRVDLNGVITDREIRPLEVEEIFPESEGLRAIRSDGRYGFVDSKGRLRIANRYENVKAFSQSLAAAKILGRWGFINHEDRIAIQPVYDEVTSFSDNYALVKQKELFGLIDRTGKLILPVRYTAIVVRPGKRFQVKQNGYWGLADAEGKVIINPKYDQLNDLDNGYVIVEREGKYGLLTDQGVSTIPLLYDGLSFDALHNQYIALRKSVWEKREMR